MKDNLPFDLQLLGTLNMSAAGKVRPEWIQVETPGNSAPVIRHHSKNQQVLIILYPRPRSKLQYLSLEEFRPDSRLQQSDISKEMQIRVVAHLKFPFNEGIQMAAVLEKVL